MFPGVSGAFFMVKRVSGSMWRSQEHLKELQGASGALRGPRSVPCCLKSVSGAIQVFLGSFPEVSKGFGVFRRVSGKLWGGLRGVPGGLSYQRISGDLDTMVVSRDLRSISRSLRGTWRTLRYSWDLRDVSGVLLRFQGVTGVS